MKFAEKIFERATVKGIADYLLYGMVPDRDDRNYETRLDDADLAYEKVAKQYDEDGASVLLSAANELVNENASVYMELGLQAGFLLIADLFQNIWRERDQDGYSMASDNYKTKEEHNPDIESDVDLDAESTVDADTESDADPDTDMASELRHSVLQQIIRNRLDTALEDTLRKDRKYQKSKQTAKEKAGRLSEDIFTPEQWDLIDDALEESNASGSEYGRVAYQQGFFDALDIFKDILLQRRDWV